MTWMHTCRCNFSPFIGFCLHSHCWTLNLRGCKAMKEANTLQGESKNHSPLLTTHLRLIKRYYSVSAILVFLYILTIFQCQFWSVDFFFLFTVQVSKVMGVQALWKMLCWSAVSHSDPPCFCHDVHWCVFVFLSLPSRRECPPVRILGPSLSPKRALFLPQCDSISLLLSAPFSYITGQNEWFIMLPTLYFIHFPNTSGTVWAYTVPRLCRHNSFICNKAMQHPGQALPLVDVCLSFLPRK